jgi:hypothetical protein
VWQGRIGPRHLAYRTVRIPMERPSPVERPRGDKDP